MIYETTIDATTLAQPNRYLHFTEANTNLLAAVKSDGGGVFSTAMRNFLPGFENTVQGATKVLGKSPGKHVTWHHVPGSNRLQLVYRYQHEQSRLKGVINDIYQGLFHPGGSGGYADGITR